METGVDEDATRTESENAGAQANRGGEPVLDDNTADPLALLKSGESDSIRTEVLTPQAGGELPDSAASREVGAQTDPIVRAGHFGKYEIVAKIGSGGFGKVYLGRDPVLGRAVAVKTCTSEDEGLHRRFLREAKIAAGLQHPNIVTVYDFGYEGEMPFMVQEYLDGEDLTEKIERGGLTLELRVDYLLSIAKGLAHAHSHGVLHRDIKPANIRVLDDGQVRILDFGIARLLNETTAFTTVGTTLGTVGYLAPEILGSDGVDERADVFSFGVLAYELLSYRRPFTGESFVRISYRLLNEKHLPLKDWVPNCPAALLQMVDICLEKAPGDRYGSFNDIVNLLTRLVEDSQAVSLGIETTPTPAVATGSTSSRAEPTAITETGLPVRRPRPLPRRGVWSLVTVVLVGLGLWGLVAAGLVSFSFPGSLSSDQSSAEATENGLAKGPENGLSAGSNGSEIPDSPATEEKSEEPGVPNQPPRAVAETPIQGATTAQTADKPRQVEAELSIPEKTLNRVAAPPDLSPDQDLMTAENSELPLRSAAIPTSGSSPDASRLEPQEEPAHATDSGLPSDEPGAPADESRLDGLGAKESKGIEPAQASVTGDRPPEQSSAGFEEDSLAAPVAGTEGDLVVAPAAGEKVLPELIEQVQPAYPVRARRRHVEATVVLGARVDVNGTVVRTLLKSCTSKGLGFEEAAKEAALRSRFRPGSVAGEPQPMWTEIVFQFRNPG